MKTFLTGSALYKPTKHLLVFSSGQFTATAPTGVMSKQSFVETFENMVSVAFGMEQLPDVWMNISPQQVSRQLDLN